MIRRFVLFTSVIFLLLASPLLAQKLDSTLFQHLRWRMIGPHRGGRTVAAVGIPDQPNVFYVGVNNGGVWRTSDYGRTWKPIFDDQPTGSIGTLAVAPSNPNIIYVGSGEGLQRPDLSVGDGMFKSTDAGATWRHLGLSDAQQIGAIIVDPVDPNRVFVAVLGHPYGANEQRGVFRSTDGGESWQKVLYKDENTGAIALSFDPTNSNIIFADLWASRQGPWENGSWQGKTSGLFKSTDGGTTWRQLTNGLPSGEQGLGRIGIAIAPNDPSRMYALVSASQVSGVYRSDDAGEHWTRTNTEDRVSGRGDDFAEVKVHPNNKDILFVLNTSTYRSTDGGSTFVAIKGAPGGDDYHGIWINPLHPDIMLLTSDQGAVITVNGGQSWSSWYNQPTAQFYHVITDNQFPYNVYGGQQESGSVGIASRGNDGQITFREWHPIGVDEWAYVAPDPLHPNIIYGGKLTRYDRSTGEVQNVAPEVVRSGKYRYLRTAPLMFSPVDPHALYLGSNVLFKTTTGGQKWDIISPDLTRELPEVPASVGIFRTPELEHQPRRGVIYALSLSSLDGKIIWAGTDDGYIHVSWNGGAHWNNVTPRTMTSWSKVAGIEAGHFDKSTVYAAVNRIKLDDMHPHIYRTHDGGKTWSEIVNGLPASGPVNVVREDPIRKGLLFAGTERAVYVSFDDGDNWLPLRRNMPATSIRDLVIHDNDIVVGTHGRSFWILDDISSLRQMKNDMPFSNTILFPPASAYRVRWNRNTDTPLPPDEPGGENPPDGALIDYYLPHDAKEVSITISDQSHTVVQKYSSSAPPDTINERELRIPTYWLRPPQKIFTIMGVHRFVWDVHYTPPEGISHSYPSSAIIHNTPSQPLGPWVKPGTYTVTLTVDEQSTTQPLTVRMDPRIKVSNAILQQQFDLSMKCYTGLRQIHKVIEYVKTLRKQIQLLGGTVNENWMKDSLASFEKKLRAVQGEGVPDDIDVVYFTVDANTAVKETFGGLQTKMLYVMALIQNADAQPTSQQVTAVATEQKTLRAMLQWWEKFTGSTLRKFNDTLKQRGFEQLKLE
jgi:photosystem II stability/assembly factor-like uncharacterized protein